MTSLESLITIGLYVQFSSLVKEATILQRSSANRPHFRLSQLSDSRVGLQIDHAKGPAKPLVSGSKVGAGRWYRLDLVYDGKSLMLFIDGKLEGREPTSFAPTVEKSDLGRRLHWWQSRCTVSMDWLTKLRSTAGQ